MQFDVHAKVTFHKLSMFFCKHKSIYHYIATPDAIILHCVYTVVLTNVVLTMHQCYIYLATNVVFTTQ